MEVVLDVNVFVSAVLSGAGPSAQLVAAMRTDRLFAVACPGLLAELGDVLRRDRFRRFLSLDEVDDYVGEIETLCRCSKTQSRCPRCFVTRMTTTSSPWRTRVLRKRSSPETWICTKQRVSRSRSSLLEKPGDGSTDDKRRAGSIAVTTGRVSARGHSPWWSVEDRH
ncbi:MAG: putative toxin-antitoxin system toxin component, PIN family [Acidimicrobiales bacterium]